MVKTLAALKSQAANDLPDNNTQLVSPADVRNMITDFLDTMTPAYGAMSISSAAGIALTLNQSPAVVVPWETVSPDTTAEYTCTPATGTISRSGLSAARVTVNMEVYFAAGKFVTVQLYNGGAATPWKFTVLGQGATKPVSVSLSAMFRGAALSLQVFAYADANNNATTFKNAVIYVSSVPVIA